MITIEKTILTKRSDRSQSQSRLSLSPPYWLCLACILLSPLLAAGGRDTPALWQLTPIPDTWRSAPPGVDDGRGFTWYRCWVKVPAAWEGREIALFVEPADDARQSFVNGALVGASGTFPPRYRSGLGEIGRYRLVPDRLRFGDWNVVAIRVYYREGRTNFRLAPPVLLAGNDAIRMQGDWQFRSGDDLSWAPFVAPSAVTTAMFSTVDRVGDVARYVKRRQDDRDPLSPSAALQRFQVPADLKVELVLSEPQIGQPLFFDFDERGRLWVLQYLQYPNPAGLQALSRDKALRTVYDKVPRPPPHHVRGTDKITIHEDTDDDGRYDRHTTFVSGLNIVSSFARDDHGVWVLNPPYLLFYADANCDDIPDGDPEVVLEGFGIEDTHSVVNSLRWGPDGWLYAAQGSTVSGRVKPYGENVEPAHSMGQLIWRFHPRTRRYEIFAEGGGNTFGVAFDAHGRVYSGTNGGNTRGFHYVQGGYYQKTFGKHGALSNPYAFGFFPPMKHHDVTRFTHDFVIYEAATLPAAYRGHLFGVEPLQGRVVEAECSKDGSSIRTRDVRHVLTTDDPWFRPVAIDVGPDGGIYVADFYEDRIDHAAHFAGRVDTKSGRIYRITRKRAPRVGRFDLRELSSRALLALFSHANPWYRQTALRILVGRRDASTIPVLQRQLQGGEGGAGALNALWALSQSTGWNERSALRLLHHHDPHVRRWTVRRVGDDGCVGSVMAAALEKMATEESSVEVRSQLAATARRLSVGVALRIVAALTKHEADVDDVHVPLLIWWAIEAHAQEREAILELFSAADFWDRAIVKEHLAARTLRRYAQAGTRQDLLTCAALLGLAPTVEHRHRLVVSLDEAFRGRALAGLPRELLEALAAAGGGSMELRVRRGDETAVADVLKTIADEEADLERRERFVRLLGEVETVGAVPVLLGVAIHSVTQRVQEAALVALQSYDTLRIGFALVAAYGELAPQARRAAAAALASRRTWSLHLLRAVEQGIVSAEDVDAAALLRMLLHEDDSITEIVQQRWGDLGGSSEREAAIRIRELLEVVDAAAGNPYDGKAIYRLRCGQCHTLFGEGGEVGPDLTVYQRGDLRTLLVHIVQPSTEIREGYENHFFLMRDGRALTGFLADRDDHVVLVRSADGQNVIVTRRDIVESRQLAQSVMPDDTLRGMSESQLRDLFAYLRATQPLP